jgi:hypothetical protein
LDQRSHLLQYGSSPAKCERAEIRIALELGAATRMWIANLVAVVNYQPQRNDGIAGALNVAK